MTLDALDAPHDPDDPESAPVCKAAYGTSDGTRWAASLKPDASYKKCASVANKSINLNNNAKLRVAIDNLKENCKKIDTMCRTYKIQDDSDAHAKLNKVIRAAETTLVEGLVLYHCGKSIKPQKLKTLVNKEMLQARTAGVEDDIHPAIKELTLKAHQMDDIS